MKKIYLTILVLVVSTLCFSQKTCPKFVSVENQMEDILISFDLPSYEIRDTSLLESYNEKELFCYIHHNDDMGVTDDIGYPYLPQQTLAINVPINSYEYKISVLEPEYEEITLKHEIVPVQEDFKERDNKFSKSEYYKSDGSNQPYPVHLSEPFIVMGEKGVDLTIFPFLYNPEKNKIKVLTHAKFKVTYSLTSKQEDYPEPSDIKKKYLSHFFANYENTLKSGSEFSGKYLIITDAMFEETITSFANYKRNIGYDVNVYTTATTGSTATSIKNFIQNKYDNSATRPDFVLLVGDYGIIPASCGNVNYDIDDPISDLDYARLDGNDYFADVFLGRFPVDDTTELQNIINKTIYMEMNLHSFDKEAKFIAGADSDTWTQNQFEAGHDYVISETFSPEGYTSYILYQPDFISVINAINGDHLFLLYSGHGSKTSWAGGTFTLPNGSLYLLDNTIYPFVFSFACHTGNFYETDCFGEMFVTNAKGAVSYFGSSVETMVNSDKAIEKKIFGDAFTDEEHISDIINLGMKRYWNRFWSSLNERRTKRYMKAYNFLGDPSLNILGLGCQDSWNFQNQEVFCNNADITYAATNYITNNNSFVVKLGANISLVAENYIRLKPGMEIKNGATFHAYIDENICNENQNKSLGIPYESFLGKEDILIIENYEPYPITAKPNPFKDKLSIYFFLETDDYTEISVYDTKGVLVKKLMSGKILNQGEHSFSFNLSELRQGVYVLNIKTLNGAYRNIKIEKI